VLGDGSRVEIVGGGPAGSLSGYFLLNVAQRVGLDLEVTIHKWRDFSRAGPGRCNMCGGIVSESLVKNLAAEGINLPPTVVRRAIDSYVLHMDVGTVRFDTPLQEMRIAAAHRGAGPRGTQGSEWKSFDDFLLTLARQKGAHVVQGRSEPGNPPSISSRLLKNPAGARESPSVAECFCRPSGAQGSLFSSRTWGLPAFAKASAGRRPRLPSAGPPALDLHKSGQAPFSAPC